MHFKNPRPFASAPDLASVQLTPLRAQGSASIGFVLVGCGAQRRATLKRHDLVGSTTYMSAAMVLGIQLTHSIAYAEHSRHRLDVCRPRNAVAAPVVIFFYGGAWQSGYKELYRYVAKALARRGYVAVVPDYRIYPEVCYPDFLDDGAFVVRWVKDNIARFGGDPDKLFLKGHSAGAHMAAMLSIDDRWLGKVGLNPRRDIAGLIGLAGPYDLMPLPLRDNKKLKVIFGGTDRPETQSIFHVSPGAPPALLMTGGRDRLVEPGNSTRLAARLVAAGNAATVLTYRHVGHFVIMAAVAPFLRFLVPVLRDVDAFIAETLRTPRRTIRHTVQETAVQETTAAIEIAGR